MHASLDVTAESSSTSAPVVTTPRSWASLIVLMFAAATLYLNQQLLSLLITPIQADLTLSDTQISTLIGFAFAITFALAGFPLGRMVDRLPRFRLIATGIVFWSLATALCASITSYWQLFLLRMAVGIGEAVLGPAAYSLMPDLFPPRRLGLTIGLFTLAMLSGAGLAMALGGKIIGVLSVSHMIDMPILGPLEPWRVTFLIIGVPSVLVGVWAAFTPEPLRHGAVASESPSIRETLDYLRTHSRCIANLILAWGLLSIPTLAMLTWTPTFLMRVFGWNTEQAGLGYGVTLFLSATGVLAGGALSDRARAYRPNGRLLLMMGAALLAIPVFASIFLARTGVEALILIGLGGFLVNAGNASVPPALQEAVPNRMRGLSSGIGLATATFLGLTLGPSSVAVVNDYILHDHSKIGLSLSFVLPIGALVSIIFAFFAWRNYSQTYLAAQAWHSAKR
ncbi:MULTISPECIES: MFS transporter [Sphingobium]|uniref:MFS transporter n=1 Tax=Sphingobium TaxID=165695 RepID=UPI0021BD5E8F|nr:MULTISPECIES: MFS transporter [Sphingobium]